MALADELIRDIVSSSQTSSGKRRRAVLRELQVHVEDFAGARKAGHSDDEIRRLFVARFGDPGQIARSFSLLYRHERAILRTSIFLLSTLAVFSLLSAAILTVQTGVAIGFGVPGLAILASRHTAIEALDIFDTVVAYVGFISLERLFAKHRFQKALALRTLIFALALAACATFFFCGASLYCPGGGIMKPSSSSPRL